jgi:hypothetical protein
MEDLQQPKIDVSMNLIKSAREELLEKFGDNPDLNKMGVFWFDVDTEKRTSKPVDELFNHSSLNPPTDELSSSVVSTS